MRVADVEAAAVMFYPACTDPPMGIFFSVPACIEAPSELPV